MPVKGVQTASFADYNGEIGSLSMNVAVRTAANWAAQETLMGDFFIALQAIVMGVRTQQFVGNRQTLSLEIAADQEAQREKKWLVQYHDATTLKRYNLEIPTADLSQLDPEDRAHAAIGDAGDVDAFIAAFEAYALTPDGNAPVVDEITFVGRNV
jgi:hypothetical protein